MSDIPEYARAFLSEEEIRRHFPKSKTSPKVSLNGRNHHVRALRQEKGLSLDELAENIGVKKAALQSLENKHWKKLSLDELELFAEAFDMPSEELLCHFKFHSSELSEDEMRSSQKDPFFVSEILEGVKVESYVRRPRDFFIGTIVIPSQRTIPANQTPKADYIFYGVLKGELLVTLPKKKYVLKPGSRFSLDSPIPYELYSSHPCREAVLAIHTSPSFL